MFVRLLVITAVLAGFAHSSCPNACKWKIQELENRVDAVEAEPAVPPAGAGSGHVYTRWGRTTCPVNSVQLYEGFVAGAYYTSNGGGANTLCLPKEPEFANVKPRVKGCGGYIYGAEYESCANNTNTPHEQDMPCAVCQALEPGPGVVLEPGRQSQDPFPKQRSTPAPKEICIENYINDK